ncbi:2Fe-2S iron-sulfur cluster-binding protein [Vibrio scophthalmi]|uniref:Ferredoxin n=2 Tax=Vibrio scophthalmi TaxID=45658 RepID=F9RM93_9VIBR|nr:MULTISPECIES: 2Fe-2S iron-sulfur cluster-binding protein [Vibrio]ANU37974.1 Ferredoxin--NAD(+) reductase [Vibrio scophthalmi]EGU32293.1 ferredoxin [Vibrio sp. N418]EGU38620.1 ferredoxin [Vibrio scophthalmi LMG 19158]
MGNTVTLLPSQVTFKVPVGQTILEAALNNNISFPHRCQIGACAMCMCKKVSGEVHYELEPMLTEQEQQQGWIFSCLAYTKSNLVLTFEE